MKILLINNYDSFVYNIVDLLRGLNQTDVTLKLNDEIQTDEAAQYDKIIISPGPATPSESGNILSIIQTLAPTHSILGICLGHQAIAEAFGGGLVQMELPHHGFQTQISLHQPHRIYQNVSMPCQVGLYHSWMVDEANFPDCLEISAYSTDGHIMSLQHKEYDVHGVQFHPESYMTQDGMSMLKNWIG